MLLQKRARDLDSSQVWAEAVCCASASSHSQRRARHHFIWPSSVGSDGAQPDQAAAPFGPLLQGGHQRSSEAPLQVALQAAAARLSPPCCLSAGGRGDDTASCLGVFPLSFTSFKVCLFVVSCTGVQKEVASQQITLFCAELAPKTTLKQFNSSLHWGLWYIPNSVCLHFSPVWLRCTISGCSGADCTRFGSNRRQPGVCWHPPAARMPEWTGPLRHPDSRLCITGNAQLPSCHDTQLDCCHDSQDAAQERRRQPELQHLQKSCVLIAAVNVSLLLCRHSVCVSTTGLVHGMTPVALLGGRGQMGFLRCAFQVCKLVVSPKQKGRNSSSAYMWCFQI